MPMKRAATLFLLVLLVSIQTPVGQLFKLPFLLEHFLKHQQQSGVSLFGFLADHYSTNHADEDWQEDERLPFKDTGFYSFGSAVLTSVATALANPPSPVTKPVLCANSGTPQQFGSRIFHPPRLLLPQVLISQTIIF